MTVLLPKRLVLDCSITMAWCLPDETTKHSLDLLEQMAEAEAVVPSIWPLEVANVLWLTEKKQRITRVQAIRFRTLLHEPKLIS